MFDKSQLHFPIILSADNFTPLTRTPWAGKDIARLYKSDLLQLKEAPKIGESWEFSCDKAFPSRIREGKGAGMPLAELFAKYSVEVLGQEAVDKQLPGGEILVKLLNADQELSLQVHPRGDESFLGRDECGKPESWLVLEAKPGAGIYMGFAHAVSKAELRSALSAGKDLRPWLNFVPVKAGDYFEIEPGVPHAIAPGSVLLEPQRVVLGKEGKTFRLWDWNRKYDAQGNLASSGGAPRALHIEEGLALVNPESQVGEKFVQTLRKFPQRLELGENIEGDLYPKNKFYQLLRVKFKNRSRVRLNLNRGYGAMLVLRGKLAFLGEAAHVTMRAGESALLANKSLPLGIEALEDSECVWIIPAYADFLFS